MTTYVNLPEVGGRRLSQLTAAEATAIRQTSARLGYRPAKPRDAKIETALAELELTVLDEADVLEYQRLAAPGAQPVDRSVELCRQYLVPMLGAVLTACVLLALVVIWGKASAALSVGGVVGPLLFTFLIGGMGSLLALWLRNWDRRLAERTAPEMLPTGGVAGWRTQAIRAYRGDIPAMALTVADALHRTLPTVEFEVTEPTYVPDQRANGDGGVNTFLAARGTSGKRYYLLAWR